MDIKIKNYTLPQFVQLLHGMELNGKKSRMRTRLLKEASKYLNEVLIVEEQALTMQYAELDDDNKPIMIDETRVEWKPETAKEAVEEFQKLNEELYHIECTEANKEIIIIVGEMLLEGNMVMSGDLASYYDQWCEEFELALEFYAKQEVEKEEE